MSQQATKSKKKSKMKLFLLLSIIGVACLAAGFVYVQKANKVKPVSSANTMVQTISLQKGNLVDTLSTSGTIFSANSQNIYSTQSYPIQKINVKVGDKVKKGDVLATLDMQNLDYDILKSELDLANAKKTIDESQNTLENNIKSSEISLQNAKINLDKQQDAYDELNKQFENGTSKELITAQNSIDTAQKNLDAALRERDSKTSDYNTKKALYDAAILSKNELETAQKAMENASISYDLAEKELNKAIANLATTKETLKQDLQKAQKDLQSTTLSYQNAQNALAQAQQKLSTSNTSVANQELSLQKLQTQRSQGDIVSTIDGTITAVNAVVGANASGILFVVQDMNDLYVSASIQEYKIGQIKIGQPAFVTAEATGTKAFKGEVSFVSPIADSSNTTNVEYTIHIQMQDSDENLKLGMNAYVNIVLQSVTDVFTVPYEAVVFTRGKGSSLYVLENQVVVEVLITTGLETNNYIEIKGDLLKENMTIIQNATAVTVGQTLDPANVVSQSEGNMMRRQTTTTTAAPNATTLPNSNQQGTTPNRGTQPPNGTMPNGGQRANGTQRTTGAGN